MPLESGSYISDFTTSNPAATDGLGQADDHLRLIKALVKNTFPAVAGAVTGTHTEINAAVGGFAAGTAKFASGSVALPGVAFLTDTDTGWSNPSANTLKGSVGATEFMAVATDGKVTWLSDQTATKFSHVGGERLVGVPVGGSIDWWSDTLPASVNGEFAWLNGQAVSRSTYSVLFGLISTTYGVGNGTTTFNIPDTCDRVTVGQGDMGGISAVARITNFTSTVLGNVFGTCDHTLTLAQSAAHDHGGATGGTAPTATSVVSGGTIAGTAADQHGGTGVTGTLNASTIVVTTTVQNHTHTIPSAGGGAAHNNMQPSIVCNKIMRIS